VIRFLSGVKPKTLLKRMATERPDSLSRPRQGCCLGHRSSVRQTMWMPFPMTNSPSLDGVRTWMVGVRVEAWIHNGKIRFLNISEYVAPGAIRTRRAPASPELEAYRPQIRSKQIEELDQDLSIIEFA